MFTTKLKNPKLKAKKQADKLVAFSPLLHRQGSSSNVSESSLSRRGSVLSRGGDHKGNPLEGLISMRVVGATEANNGSAFKKQILQLQPDAHSAAAADEMDSGIKSPTEQKDGVRSKLIEQRVIKSAIKKTQVAESVQFLEPSFINDTAKTDTKEEQVVDTNDKADVVKIEIPKLEISKLAVDIPTNTLLNLPKSALAKSSPMQSMKRAREKLKLTNIFLNLARGNSGGAPGSASSQVSIFLSEFSFKCIFICIVVGTFYGTKDQLGT